MAETLLSSVTLQAAYAAGKRHFGFAALFSALLNLLFIAPMLYLLQIYHHARQDDAAASGEHRVQ